MIPLTVRLIDATSTTAGPGCCAMSIGAPITARAITAIRPIPPPRTGILRLAHDNCDACAQRHFVVAVSPMWIDAHPIGITESFIEGYLHFVERKHRCFLRLVEQPLDSPEAGRHIASVWPIATATPKYVHAANHRHECPRVVIAAHNGELILERPFLRPLLLCPVEFRPELISIGEFSGQPQAPGRLRP